MPYVKVYCPLCGGDGWVLATERRRLLCGACGAPMRGNEPPRDEERTGPPLWVESQNFARGWLGGK